MVKKRYASVRQRSRERGATLFVVVLAITLLTGVGLYTVHASSLAARAAGNGRESLQAAHIAEANAISMLSDLRVEPYPILQEAINADPNFPCEMNYGLANATCKQQVTGDRPPPSGAVEVPTDSLGQLGTLSAKARLEVTDVNELEIPIPGHDVNAEKLRFYRATVTVVGQLNPAGLGASSCTGNMMQVTGQHIIRTHLFIGPTGLISKQKL